MMEWQLAVIILAVLAGLYIANTFMYRPLRRLLSLAVCLVTGTVLVTLLNWCLGFFNMHVAFNLFTVLVAGILHLPGLVMLVVLSQWFA